MTKKKASKTTKTNEKPAANSTTVLSVRFSEEELEYVKQAAKLKGIPPATFVRKSATQASIEIINAMSDQKQRFALEKLAMAIAKHLKGKGLLQITSIEPHEHGGIDYVTRNASSYGCIEDPEDPTFSRPQVIPKPLNKQDMAQLLLAIQHAAHPFIEALSDSLQKDLGEEGDPIFMPAISKNPE